MLTLTTGQYSGDIVANVSVGGLILSLTDYRQDVPGHGMHSHANPHLSLFLSGGFVVRSSHDESECHPGHVVLFKSGDTHATQSKRPQGCAVNIEITSSYFAQYELDENDLTAAFANAPDTRLILFSAYRSMLRDDAASRLSVDCAFLQWLRPSRRNSSSRVPAWAYCLREYLHAHWHAELTLIGLSRVVGCHPVTIARYFPSYFGCTVGEYVRRLRADAAAGRIRGSEESFADIAHACGFSDQSHLTRTLRRYTGFAPRQLRTA